MKTLILTPNNTLKCGMYQLAKGMEGEIRTLRYNNPLYRLFPFVDLYHAMLNKKKNECDRVITFIYPMHLFGKWFHKNAKWIVYDQGIPPAFSFKSFRKKIYITLFSWLNWNSMNGCDEYIWVGWKKQQPKFRKKTDFAIYIGRTEDYKHFNRLKKICKRLNIPLEHPDGDSDELVHAKLSHAKLLITTSEWEGYGRPVMEALALGIPVVCFDTGIHKSLFEQCKGKGFVVENHNFKLFEEKVKEAWKIYS